MHFTNSTQNEKIEALWSQMMKQHNQSIKHDNMDQIENGFYNPTDHVQKWAVFSQLLLVQDY